MHEATKLGLKEGKIKIEQGWCTGTRQRTKGTERTSKNPNVKEVENAGRTRRTWSNTDPGSASRDAQAVQNKGSCMYDPSSGTSSHVHTHQGVLVHHSFLAV